MTGGLAMDEAMARQDSRADVDDGASDLRP